MTEVDVVIPLHDSSGELWHTVRRRLDVEVVESDDDDEELVACLPVTLDINDRTATVELRFLAVDLEAGEPLVFPVVLDPVPGGGPVAVEEVSA